MMFIPRFEVDGETNPYNSYVRYLERGKDPDDEDDLERILKYDRVTVDDEGKNFLQLMKTFLSSVGMSNKINTYDFYIT